MELFFYFIVIQKQITLITLNVHNFPLLNTISIIHERMKMDTKMNTLNHRKRNNLLEHILLYTKYLTKMKTTLFLKYQCKLTHF